jgi:hypothetical protein
MVASPVQPSVGQWLLKRKLSRRAPAQYASAAARVVVIRAWSAGLCLVAMLLLAWAGAFVRAVSAQHWQSLKTLDGTALVHVSQQAGGCQSRLFPVLFSWAMLLLLTPAGFFLAFRAAAVAAGILGCLDFAPPSFWVTSKVAPVTDWLMRTDKSWSRFGMPYLLVSVAAAYVLLSVSATAFGGLDLVSCRARRARYGVSSASAFIRKCGAVVVALVVLLATVWAAADVRRALGAPAGGAGGQYIWRDVVIAAVLAVLVCQVTSSDRWLTAVALLAAVYVLVPDTLTHAWPAWGAGSLRAALFGYVPGSMLGTYLVGRLLR